MSIERIEPLVRRVTYPTKLANGDSALPWWLDPYLQDTGLSLWGSAISAKGVSGPGWSGFPSNGGSVLLRQTGKSFTGPVRAYVNVIKSFGPFEFWTGSGNNEKFNQPGAYLVDRPGNSTLFGISVGNTCFINDPYFKTVRPGLLPTSPTKNPQWVSSSGTATKQDNGSVSLDLSPAIGTSILDWYCDWSPSDLPSTAKVTVYSLPSGGALRFIGVGGTTEYVITAPGTYEFPITFVAGSGRIRMSNDTSVPGNANIVMFMVQDVRVPQVWEGDMYFQCDWLTCAPLAIFNRLFFPQTIHMATSFEQPDLAGWSPPPSEPILGYGQAPPPSGYFRVGDTIRNNCAIAGSFSGWRCTAAGNPGTWQPLARL